MDRGWFWKCFLRGPGFLQSAIGYGKSTIDNRAGPPATAGSTDLMTSVERLASFRSKLASSLARGGFVLEATVVDVAGEVGGEVELVVDYVFHVDARDAGILEDY